MNWISLTLSWYVVLLIIGIVFVPLTRLILGKFFFDRGYPFAKTIGIIGISYAIYVFSMIRVLPFTWESLVFILFMFAILNGWVFWRMKQKVTKFQILQDKRTIAYIVFEEILFLVALLWLAFVRGQESSIRGLEKFMDYGIMQSIFRTDYFPPLDMWLSADPKQPGGYPINYYYFGHLTGTMLIKLSQIPQYIGYNLVLATIFAQGVTLAFSLCSNLIFNIKRHIINDDAISRARLLFYGLLGTFFVNLGGNLHTIYAFTKGYNPDNPPPFWTIMLSLPEMFDPARPSTYWYPNATRFIPKTIHEFPSYSYVVADLHGHVFDIPFVMLTLALLLTLTLYGLRGMRQTQEEESPKKIKGTLFQKAYSTLHHFSHTFIRTIGIHVSERSIRLEWKFTTVLVVLLGFMTAVHYMTNALNGPIYLLLSMIVLFIVCGPTVRFVSYLIVLAFTFFLFSFPFSSHFIPFASGIGVNCSPEFLTDIGKLGPLLFEKGNCQISTWWMLFTLWGFFWIGFVLFLIALLGKNQMKKSHYQISLFKRTVNLTPVDIFTMLLFAYGIFLTIVPEFIYAKDIYPDHFRANTMFKLGYQAFIMMNMATIVVLFRIRLMNSLWRYLLKAIYFFLAFFIVIYPVFAFPSYYPNSLNFFGLGAPENAKPKEPVLDGKKWIENEFPQDAEIINYFEEQVKGQPVILEAQGDSYTDFNKISAYTGLPTIAGWWVHEWLWRGSAGVVGDRIPDIETIYNTEDPVTAQRLLQKYNVDYIVVSGSEKEKYKSLNEAKFKIIATEVFKTKNGVGRIYKINK